MEKGKNYAICELCDSPMSPQNGCSCSHFNIKSKKYERIKYGNTSDFDDYAHGNKTCHDCNVGVGQYYHFGCDMERCPVCHEQLIGCEDVTSIIGFISDMTMEK